MQFHYVEKDKDQNHENPRDMCGLEGLMQAVHFLPEGVALIVTKDYKLVETEFSSED